MGKVLVVEDDEFNIQMWEEVLLKRVGLTADQIVCAMSYPEALAVVEAEGSSLVMVATDINLGSAKTGLDLISEILPNLPAVVVSSEDYDDPKVRLPIEQRRVRGALTLYCHKPVRLDDYAANVLACLHQPAGANALA